MEIAGAFYNDASKELGTGEQQLASGHKIVAVVHLAPPYDDWRSILKV